MGHPQGQGHFTKPEGTGPYIHLGAGPKHDPSRIAKVDDFLRKYPTRNILAALTKKYGAAPVTTTHSHSSLHPSFVDNLQAQLDDALPW